MVNDKDIDVVMSLLPRDAHYYFTQAQTHRAIPAEVLAEKYRNTTFKLSNLQTFKPSNFQTFTRVADAIQAATKAASDKDIIFIGGSNYVVGEAISHFSRLLTHY